MAYLNLNNLDTVFRLLLQSHSNFFFPRLLCALEGNYLVEEYTAESTDNLDNFEKHDELQSINFYCSIPAVNGRGFIEVLFASVSCRPSWPIGQSSNLSKKENMGFSYYILNGGFQ